jgi:hypothetical protein
VFTKENTSIISKEIRGETTGYTTKMRKDQLKMVERNVRYHIISTQILEIQEKWENVPSNFRKQWE